MTSTKFMRISLMTLALLALSGCNTRRLTQPQFHTAPYERAQVWAVAPFNNESGVSIVQGDRVADMFVQQLQDVRGINALPVNRVILAMRELDIPYIQSAHDASRLLSVLGADGLIVGTTTAYDPYRPMTFGAAIELHVADHALPSVIDTRSLSRSASAHIAPGELGPRNPVAQTAGIFDARNHETLAQLQHYASGRSVPDSAFGSDIYLVRMDLYMQFASYRLLGDLLNSEQIRLSPIVEESPPR